MPTSPAAAAAQKFYETYGALVTGGPKTLPQTATGGIFTVATGRVIVTSLTGSITTVIQTQATTLSVGNTPSGGSHSTASFCATLDLNAKPVGTTLCVPQAAATALLASTANGTFLWNTTSGGQGVPFVSGGLLIVPAGTIDVTTVANSSGAIQWSVTYIPYDVGAVITAL
jgi:hypothetical protein